MFLLVFAGRVSAQNLFEVQVFPDEILDRGETEVEFHSVMMPSGTRLPDDMLDHSTHVHLSFELSHGWTKNCETGALLKQPGDEEFRQALAITPILERHVGAFEMSFNPAFEIALKGPDAGESPVFEPSAKIASRISRIAWLGVEYYADTGPIKQFEPISEQHHLVFPTIDIRAKSGWKLNLGVGRGLTGGSEHWVVKSIMGMPLPQ
jgi:hypothetical protein